MVRRVVALSLLLASLALAACAPAALPTEAGVDGDAQIVTREMAFVPTTLRVVAERPSTLLLVNEDAAPHNVAIYRDSSASEALFVGELISSSSVTYELPSLAPGSYFFRCDLHPEMTGMLVVED
jgi:plastocyanin